MTRATEKRPIGLVEGAGHAKRDRATVGSVGRACCTVHQSEIDERQMVGLRIVHVVERGRVALAV